MGTTQTPACEFHLLGNGVYHCIWHSNQVDAVEEYVVHLANVYSRSEPGRVRRWLHLDAGTGLPAIHYFMQKMRDLERRYPDRLPNRSAVLYGGGVKPLMLNALATLTTIRGKDSTRFFPLEQRTEAVLWLMQEI